MQRSLFKYVFFYLLLVFAFDSFSQKIKNVADSICTVYRIPELAYAVVSSDSIYELEVIGVKKINTTLLAEKNDRFRIGSNTKAITGFVAALLVKQNKINWNTKFFDLYPELKSKKNKVFHSVTLLELLSFRARLFSYTYTYAKPSYEDFSGDETEQRYQFTKWFFEQKPIAKKDSVHFSNLGYVAAGMMLEKVSGKNYKQLVGDFGKQLGIDFKFGAPNSSDLTQPWGHDNNLIPEKPGDNYKLNWLLAAGNINVCLPDYVKFIQLQLKGLQGKSDLLTMDEFHFLHFGLFKFSVGWFAGMDEAGHNFSYNIGNPGTFLSKVFIYPYNNIAIILLSNAQSDEVDAGMEVLMTDLKRDYFH